MVAKKFIALVILVTVVVLLIGACQAGEETATQETTPSTSPDTASEVPEVPDSSTIPTDTPDALASSATLLTAAISELNGLVEMKQAGNNAFVEADPDATLEVNGQVQTGDNGKARLDLSSGTIVRVSPSSLFTLIDNQEADGGLVTKLKLELGRIFIILNGGSMEVETPSGVASVLGSYLKVEFDPDDETLELTCLEGNCSVVGPGGETIDFTDGQKIVIRKDPNTGEWIVEEGPMTTDDFIEWLENNPEAKALVDAALNAPGTSGGGGSCLGLLHPENGSDFFTFGGVDFEWEAQDGAARYVVSFTYPTGQVVQFATTDTSMTRYIESMPPGGDYSWNVTAYDEGGAAICTAESLIFTKADTQKWLDQQKEKKQDDDPAPTEPVPTEPVPTEPVPTEPVCDPCSEACFDVYACESQIY